jgi:choline dehydrogenase-like flavoprotein
MSPDQYDAVVVGSGAGGAAAAYRLVLGGLRVALIEKGDHLPTDGSTLDVGRVVRQGAFFSREDWLDGRGRRFTPEEHFNVGGKTKWYGAALLRFSEREFLPDPVHGCPGWPLTLRDLTPYYQEAERLLGIRTFGCEPDLARILKRLITAGSSWRTEAMPMGLAAEITAHRAEAAHFDGFASVRNLKNEAETSILSLLRSQPNFTLMVSADARTLLGSPASPTTITGVRLADGRELHARRVFLAAGALHSPRILSRYLASSGLSTKLPAAALVGRYLKLHLLTAMVAVSSRSMSDLIRKTVVLTNERFPHSSVQPLGFDSELIASLVPKFVPGFLRRQIGRRAYGFFLQTEDGSDASNRVIEDPQRSALPVLDYDETRLAEASREHRAFTRAFQRALVRAGLVGLTRRIGLSGTAHACGSLICGRDATDSVVDARGHVHGMNGLYVVDGSILPRSSRVNPSLSIYAWALRVGDLAAREFQGERSSVRCASEEVSHAR